MGDFLVYTIGFPITFLLLVMGMALAARRILGLRIGLIRTALACLLAMSVASSAFGETTVEPTAGLVTLQLGLSILAVIGVLAFAEIIVPTGSIPPPTEWWACCAAESRAPAGTRGSPRSRSGTASGPTCVAGSGPRPDWRGRSDSPCRTRA